MVPAVPVLAAVAADSTEAALCRVCAMIGVQAFDASSCHGVTVEPGGTGIFASVNAPRHARAIHADGIGGIAVIVDVTEHRDLTAARVLVTIMTCFTLCPRDDATIYAEPALTNGMWRVAF